MIGRIVTCCFTRSYRSPDGYNKIFPSRITQWLLKFSRKPKLDFFTRDFMRKGIKLALHFRNL